MIAVTDDILEQDENHITLTVLRQILAHCGMGERYCVLPVSELSSLTGRWMPYLLVESSPCQEQGLPCFSLCVSDYDSVRGGAERPRATYSLEAENADFAARNVRRLRDAGYTFDLVGLGIIGRIHTISDSAAILRPTLIAASAALSCGVSFADVVEVLNGISTMLLHDHRMAR
ncbi:MAG: hypothetical protein PUC32_02555 [Oscillospiraceae bacterium]|nr:hypothetical protein [Oscillospiraceae bacterium]